MNITEIKRNQIVNLAIPNSLPVWTMDGVFHTNEYSYRVLGFHAGSMVRLSRLGDNAKLIVEPSILYPLGRAAAVYAPRAKK